METNGFWGSPILRNLQMNPPNWQGDYPLVITLIVFLGFIMFHPTLAILMSDNGFAWWDIEPGEQKEVDLSEAKDGFNIHFLSSSWDGVYVNIYIYTYRHPGVFIVRHHRNQTMFWTFHILSTSGWLTHTYIHINIYIYIYMTVCQNVFSWFCW